MILIKLNKHSYEISNYFFLNQNLINIYLSNFDSIDDSLKWKKKYYYKKNRLNHKQNNFLIIKRI